MCYMEKRVVERILYYRLLKALFFGEPEIFLLFSGKIVNFSEEN